MSKTATQNEIIVGTGVTQLFYTDTEPWEVIRVISDKTLEIRHMNSKLDANWKPEIIPGGFAGHCTNNNTQRWNISSNPDGHICRIRLCVDGQWKYKGQRFSIGKAQRHHDYNF